MSIPLLPPDFALLEEGNPLVMGAVIVSGAVNFSIFSRNATGMFLCLYAHASDQQPAREFRLKPEQNRTGDIWHCRVPGIGAGALYLWRAEGPFAPELGLRFNAYRVLLDPYAKALTAGAYDLSAARICDQDFRRNDGQMPKCVVVDDAFDWKGDTPLNYPLKDCVIYETHVRGLTRSAQRNKAAGHSVTKPGTYDALIETIPYFKKLGITSIELLPVQEFDTKELFRRNPFTKEALSNYWGYSPLAFFAPKASYAYTDDELRALGQPQAAVDASLQVREFKRMVRELHAAGLEVILDVVFNHTAEGNEQGPTVSFRGLDNDVYYMLESDKRYYKNYSGCGNTLNCNHPVTRTLIMDCLRYWVVQMHVDGFRFDLGSILGRDAQGKLLENPPVIEAIAEDPLLRDTKIIAEAWDAGGAYQVGAFPGGRWAEWNDRFRDDVRRFWRGDEGGAVHLATRITGSSDLYLRDGRKPFHSINFVTAHDGFTLNDLVSYEEKHNEANGEQNTDGATLNFSNNFGVEGKVNADAADHALVEEARNRQIKNFLATLLLSVGTPMLLGGDEFRRSQGGNNNAYCQDNATSWYDWSLPGRHADILRFTTELIHFRRRHPAFRRAEFFTGIDAHHNDMPDITWFDEEGRLPDWSDIDRRIAARIDGSPSDSAADADFYLMFNASEESAAFVVPRHPQGRIWHLVVDSARASPDDIASPGAETALVFQNSYALAPSSIVLLLAR